MSDSEGEQQRTEKDEVSQPVAELARQILRAMESQKQTSPGSSGSTGEESTSKGKLLPCLFYFVKPTLYSYSECETIDNIYLRT